MLISLRSATAANRVNSIFFPTRLLCRLCWDKKGAFELLFLCLLLVPHYSRVVVVKVHEWLNLYLSALSKRLFIYTECSIILIPPCQVANTMRTLSIITLSQGQAKPLVVVFILWVMLGLQGCAINPATGERDFVLMSESQELELGRQYHEEITKHMPVLENEALQAYVSAVGQRIAKNSDRSDIAYHFTVLDSADVNAFALPGGYIYITRGLMAYLNSEAELAAVLGHEIAHVTARHAVRGHAMSTATSLLTIVAAVKTGTKDGFQLANVLNSALVAGYGRQLELEADQYGANYIANSAYEPAAILKVLGFLKYQEQFEVERAQAENRKPRVYHGVFATHPDNDTRLQEVVNQGVQQDTQQDTQPGTEQPSVVANGVSIIAPEGDYLELIKGVPFGHSTAEGVYKRVPADNVPGYKRQFLHQDLKIAFDVPEGWVLHNFPDRVILQHLVPDRPEAQRKNDIVVLTSQELPEADAGMASSPELFVREQLKFTDVSEAATVPNQDGLPAWRGIANQGPFFDKSAQFVGVVHANGRAYILSTQPNYVDAELVAGAEQVLRSFASLSEQQLPQADAMRILVVQAQPGQTYAELATSSPLPAYAEQQLRLLNGDYPDQEPVAGEWIKIIQ